MGSWSTLLLMAACVTVQATSYRENSLGRPPLKIHGGDPAKPNSVPHQVITYVEDEVWCGGSIIDSTHILTAGHCCFYAAITHVVAGEHNLSKAEGPEQKIRVATYKIHEQFQVQQVLNDICILRLEKPLKLNDWVQNVRLPERGFTVNEGTNCTVSGWGLTEFNVPSDVLLFVNVSITNDQTCFDNWGGNSTIVICAGGVAGKGSCMGDSGGPLVCSGTHTGVVSGGPKPCAVPGVPGFYAKTSGFINWINDHIAKEQLP